MIRKGNLILLLSLVIFILSCQESSVNLFSKTVEIPAMEAKVIIEYPTVIYPNWFDGKYYPEVRFRTVYSKGSIFVDSGNWYIYDYDEPQYFWQGRGFSQVELRSGRTSKCRKWFDMKKPIRGKLRFNLRFWKKSEESWLLLMQYPVEIALEK